jgi:hypothetical protein
MDLLCSEFDSKPVIDCRMDALLNGPDTVLLTQQELNLLSSAEAMSQSSIIFSIPVGYGYHPSIATLAD